MSELDREREELAQCEVTAVEPLAADLLRLTARPPSVMRARAGQFAMIRGAWGSEPLLARPMSYLSAGDEVEFLVRVHGRGTGLLAQARVGEVLTVLGPLGTPFGEPRTDRVIVVAGGCGLAPALFAARELAAAGQRPSFLYGARTEEQLVLRERVSEVADVRIATDDGSAGHAGPVTELLPSLLEGGGDSFEVWCCGPEAMMAAAARVAHRAGAHCKVSVEERMACGRGLCLGCAAVDARGEPRYVCVEGPVFDAPQLYGEDDG